MVPIFANFRKMEGQKKSHKPRCTRKVYCKELGADVVDHVGKKLLVGEIHVFTFLF